MNPNVFLISALIFSLLSNSPMILAQLNSPCSPTILSSVTGSGCMNFLTGSGTFRPQTVIGMDCLCPIVTASVPINLPINRTLAISLPRACGIQRPVSIFASASPLPAPGPVSFGSTTSPTIPGDPAFLGPTTLQYPDVEQDNPETDNRRGSNSLPSSSLSFKLSFLLLAFAFEIIDFF